MVWTTPHFERQKEETAADQASLTFGFQATTLKFDSNMFEDAGMPVMIGTLGAGGLGVNDINGLRMVGPTVASASRWLEAAAYSFPNEDLLRRFLANNSGRYGFLDYGRFFSDLCTMIYSGPTKYYDLYAGKADSQYRPVRTAPLQFLLENLRLGVALPIPLSLVTPEDLFALSAIWGAEIALTLSGGNLHVFSQGRSGAVRVPHGHIVLAHTHPTKTHERTQVDGDIEVAGENRAEIVITEDMIIYFTRNKVINERRGELLQPLPEMCIARDTRLTAELFLTLHTEYLQVEEDRKTAEHLKDQQESERRRARNSATSSTNDSEDTWMSLFS